jgi:hypothetical protein
VVEILVDQHIDCPSDGLYPYPGKPLITACNILDLNQAFNSLDLEYVTVI